MEIWQQIPLFPLYEASNAGRIRKESSQRVLQEKVNQYGVVGVGLMRDGVQYHRSVPLLVSLTFIERPHAAFDTPINLDGNRMNNAVDNLMWRPRWFARKYNKQFKQSYDKPINQKIVDLETSLTYENSWDVATTFGLLEKDLVLSILNRTYVWPTYQQFDAMGF